jgi:hypothetical protein
MIQRGVITPSCSEWAAPVILVKRKSMDGTPKYRFCTDFRGLNAVTKIPVHPIPYIKSNLSLMAGSRCFTLLHIGIFLYIQRTKTKLDLLLLLAAFSMKG